MKKDRHSGAETCSENQQDRDRCLCLPPPDECVGERPKVSVLMITYNHEDFIEQAVYSVLKQECDFLFEIVVGDDASSDRTMEKLTELQLHYPEIIRVLPADKNQGITANFIRTLVACRGSYIAMLEGDDYWIDSRKLQDQVDQLEKDATLSLSAGRTRNRLFHGTMKPRYTQVDLLRRYLFHTSTLVFRRADMSKFELHPDVLALDTLLIAHLMTRGDCGCIDRELSYYRRHVDGAWNRLSCVRQIMHVQDVTDVLSKQFEHRYDAALLDREVWIYGMMMHPDSEVPLLEQWMSRGPLLKPLIFRTFLRHPLGSSRRIMSLLFFPVGVGMAQMRRWLGIRTRVHRWLGSLKTDAKSNKLQGAD
jgi:glycosyltransferase involved in cell wall biosynthesis